MKWLIPFAVAMLASLPIAASADPPEGKGYKAHGHHGEDEDEGNDQGEGRDHDRRRPHHGDRDVRRAFNDDERGAINGYYGRHRYGDDEEEEHRHDRGDELPPGWERKLRRGERIPDDVWAHRAPLPPEIVVKLPPPPGVVLVRIHDHVVRVIERTHEVLDDLGIPHPPTPP